MEEPRIDKTIYTGRPENTEGRLEKEIADPEAYVKQKFQGKDVSYEKTVLEDGTIIFDIQTSMIRQRCSFTEI